MKKSLFVFLILCAVILSSCVIDYPDITVEVPKDRPVECVGNITVGCFSFVLYSDRTAVLSEIDTTKEINYHAENVIPEIVDRKYDVVEIGDSAFENTDFENIVLPKTLKKISSRAFRRSNIKSVVIPENVTVIEKEAFDNCAALTSCEIKGKITEIADGTFFNCLKLEKVTVPDTVRRIGDDAFSMCAKLTDFIFPKSLEEIGDYAFSSSGVKNPGLPSSVKLGENAFSE